MAYIDITEFNSPNYTPNAETRSVWGRDRNIQGIVIHWWGDPNQNPTFEGIVNYLCRPGGNTSAHYVVTGTGRRCACIVSPEDNAWASNSANPISISIECDPRCRDEDYDTVAEVIADLRKFYGDLPLWPHNQFAQTACPGNYNLGRLDTLARQKANPIQPPPPVTEVSRDVYNPLKRFKVNADTNLQLIPTHTPADSTVYAAGTDIDIAQLLTFSDGSKFYRTKYSADKELAKGFDATKLDEVITTPPPEQVPPPDKPPVEQPVGDEPDYGKENNTLLKTILEWLRELLARFGINK